MAILRSALVSMAGATVLVAAAGCSAESPPASTSQSDVEIEPERVPDPPPRYKRVDLDAGITLPPDEQEPQLQIKCGGHEPYVCPLEDGTFRCSDHPCIPGCERVGCLGGDVCMPCDGGFRCVAAGSRC